MFACVFVLFYSCSTFTHSVFLFLLCNPAQFHLLIGDGRVIRCVRGHEQARSLNCNFTTKKHFSFI